MRENLTIYQIIHRNDINRKRLSEALQISRDDFDNKITNTQFSAEEEEKLKLTIDKMRANRVKKRVITSSYCTGHGVQLVQHEGGNTIYQADKKVFDLMINAGAVDVISRWIEPDQTQRLLPAVLIMGYFLIDDCCDDDNCDEIT